MQSLPAATAPLATLLAYVVLIAAAAVAGGSSVAFLSLGHRRMQVLLSFTGGVLLGVGLLHLVPHAVAQLGGDVEAAVGWVVGGFFVMFMLERAFHGHAHHAADGGCVGAGHDHRHGPGAGSTPATAVDGRSRWGWCGAFAGLALHSLADGAALAASVNADAAHGGTAFAGFATFLAIVLHKPFDSAIIATLMRESGISPRVRKVVNVLYAAVVPVGAAAFLISLPLVGGLQGLVLGCAMAMAAGAFICIAAADLLPEVQFHSHDRVLLTTALGLGLALAWGIAVLERGSAAHAHGHGHVPAIER